MIDGTLMTENPAALQALYHDMLLEECKGVLERIVGFYNNERPHMSIGWQTPNEAHTQYGEQRRCWKNYYHTSSTPVQAPTEERAAVSEPEANAV